VRGGPSSLNPPGVSTRATRGSQRHPSLDIIYSPLLELPSPVSLPLISLSLSLSISKPTTQRSHTRRHFAWVASHLASASQSCLAFDPTAPAYTHTLHYGHRAHHAHCAGRPAYAALRATAAAAAHTIAILPSTTRSAALPSEHLRPWQRSQRPRFSTPLLCPCFAHLAPLPTVYAGCSPPQQ
jgi:hypothetical protein